MYAVGGDEVLRDLDDIPQSHVGAPLPIILSDEFTTVVAYYKLASDPTWDGQSVKLIDPVTTSAPSATVCFRSCRATYFGAPNDEAFSGHPLASRGLQPYSAVEVLHSSWIRQLERMNSVHPSHNPDSFAYWHHYILSFHDSTFECVARRYDVTSHDGPLDQLLPAMHRTLRKRT